MNPSPRNPWPWYFLLGTQLLTAGLLVALLARYRIPQKAWRRLVTEQRIPGWSEPFRQNRNYDSSRALFAGYRPSEAKILILGDSLIAGPSWRELLGRDDLGERGIDGDNSAGLLHRLGDDSDLAIDALVILIGTNDLLRGVEAGAVLANIESILEKARSLWPDARLYLVTPPGFASWVEHAEQRNRATATLAEGLALLASRGQDVFLVDLRSRLQDESGQLRPRMTSDGVHLSAAAYAVLRELLQQSLPEEQNLKARRNP